MEAFSGNLVSDLLDLTTRYLSLLNLRSFLLPLPFCDESLLDRKAVLAKILSNSSSLSRQQLFEVIHSFKREQRAVSSCSVNFNKAYDVTLGGSRKGKHSTRLQNAQPVKRTALRTSTTALTEKLTEELSSMHSPVEIASKLDEVLRGISKSEVVGFVMVIAAEKKNRGKDEEDQQLIPIAGGVVEILDPEEHCLRCIWCDPRLTNKDDSEFGKILLLKLLAHMFDYGYDGTVSSNRLKHASVLNIHGILFPNSIYTFMINGLKFGKHFETQDNGGSHEDTSSNLCRCQRLIETADAELFWGISESRLKNTFYNMRSQLSMIPSEHTMDALQAIVVLYA
ncbi:hypothetical protein BgAZ_400280 [Babesia gibsoni]|uniref:Uncharacterized protein n=1 Tax=Babesia gibsoni TaxID=33632 RepID=A0AAD8LM90_BABGI|nr:hypothetical protein BgAZ_400280 [Babesia gibsoni]